jgi:hypothetical protein
MKPKGLAFSLIVMALAIGIRPVPGQTTQARHAAATDIHC